MEKIKSFQDIEFSLKDIFIFQEPQKQSFSFAIMNKAKQEFFFLDSKKLYPLQLVQNNQNECIISINSHETKNFNPKSVFKAQTLHDICKSRQLMVATKPTSCRAKCKKNEHVKLLHDFCKTLDSEATYKIKDIALINHGFIAFQEADFSAKKCACHEL